MVAISTISFMRCIDHLIVVSTKRNIPYRVKRINFNQYGHPQHYKLTHIPICDKILVVLVRISRVIIVDFLILRNNTF